MSEAPQGFSTSPYRKSSEDEIAELQKHLPSVRLREQASLIEQQATRIKELEAVVKKLWRRQDSLGTFDAAVNDILSPLFDKQTPLGTSAAQGE
jgi:ppGpp synthetase/RelA/SpoT-type nucleotidyltranferase